MEERKRGEEEMESEGVIEEKREAMRRGLGDRKKEERERGGCRRTERGE